MGICNGSYLELTAICTEFLQFEQVRLSLNFREVILFKYVCQTVHGRVASAAAVEGIDFVPADDMGRPHGTRDRVADVQNVTGCGVELIHDPGSVGDATVV